MQKSELAEWLDTYGAFDGSPWMEWFDEKYCKKCESEKIFIPYLNKESECSYCEVYHKCRFFPELKDDAPNNLDIIRFWLDEECENCPNSNNEVTW